MGVFSAPCPEFIALIVIVEGETAGNVPYPGLPGKTFVIVCYI